MRAITFIVLVLATTVAAAEPWTFSPAMDVSDVNRTGVFPHLDSSGRKNIAVGPRHVAVVWEDNRNGSPQAYIAIKHLNGTQFPASRRLSAGREAFEPVVVWLRDDVFVAAWEEDGRIVARLCGDRGLGPPHAVGRPGSAHAALAAKDGKSVAAAWAQQEMRYTRVMSAWMQYGADGGLRPVRPVPVEAAVLAGNQSYPALEITNRGIVAAWEDGRNPSNILLAAHSQDGKRFSTPKQINEVIKKSAAYGEASTVARISLTTPGGDDIAALWLDKRAYISGYKVYASLSRDGGRRFGANEKVQDAFGDSIPQWHASIVADAKRMVAVWDDSRDDTPDVWMAVREDGAWSDNISVLPASGKGAQTSPAAVLDAMGNVHLAWLSHDGEVTRVRYSVGRPGGPPSMHSLLAGRVLPNGPKQETPSAPRI